MKLVKFLVVHCSATSANRDIGASEIRAMHKKNGWRDIGYHYVIRRDGAVENGRADTVMGAHVSGHNDGSLGICSVGGVKPNMTAEINFTPQQFAALRQLLTTLQSRYPGSRICGHRDPSPDRNGDGVITTGEWVKECPTFNVDLWWSQGVVQR